MTSIYKGINPKLARRIAEGLVRVDDILNNGYVYGGISDQDRQRIRETIDSAQQLGIDYTDAVNSLVEYLADEVKIMEIGPIMPVTGMTRPAQAPKPAATAQTQQAVTPPGAAANVNVSGQSTTTQPEIDQQQLIKIMGDRIKDPNVSKDFAELLAKVMQRK